MERGNMEEENKEGNGGARGLLKRLQALPFLVPTVLVALVIGLAVAAYEPLVFDPDAYTSSQAYAEDLVTTVVDEDAGSSANVATTEYDESDYAVDTSDLQDGVYYGSAYGYRSTITVKVTISGGEIVSIEIVSQDEDSAYFSLAKTIISSIISAQSTSVDTISGATYSSKGILMAVANALAQAQGSSAATTSAAMSGTTSTSSETLSESMGIDLSDSELIDGVYTGSSYGYKSTITVQVTISGGKIVSIDIVSEDDDPAYFNPAWKQIIADILAGQTTSVDIYSGATYSSEGIICAVEDALSQALADDDSGSSDNGSDDSESGDGTSEDAASGDSGSDDEDEAGSSDSGSSSDDSEDDAKYLDGTYTAYAYCGDDDEDDFEPYYVVVTVVIEDGVPVDISDYYATNDVGDDEAVLSEYDEDNEDYLWWAAEGRTTRTGTWEGVISQLIDGLVAATDIEPVSGATYSSNAIAEAYSKCLEQAAEAYEAAQSDLSGEDAGDDDSASDTGLAGSASSEASVEATSIEEYVEEVAEAVEATAEQADSSDDGTDADDADDSLSEGSSSPVDGVEGDL